MNVCVRVCEASAQWEDYEEKWSERYLQQAASMQKAQGLRGRCASPQRATPQRTRATGPGRPRKASRPQLSRTAGLAMLSVLLKAAGTP